MSLSGGGIAEAQEGESPGGSRRRLRSRGERRTAGHPLIAHTHGQHLVDKVREERGGQKSAQVYISPDCEMKGHYSQAFPPSGFGTLSAIKTGQWE